MFVTSPPTLIINIQIDSLALLSGAPVHDSVWIVDNSAASEIKGRSTLRSVAMPGQRVRWTLTSVDLQAPALLHRIRFVDHHDDQALRRESEDEPEVGRSAFRGSGRALSWEGFVPLSATLGLRYPYEIFLSFGSEGAAPFVLSGCEISLRAEPVAELIEVSGSTWANEAFAMSGGVL